MEINFDDIGYLKTGNALQQRVYDILVGYRVMEKLRAFDPVLTGTIPINIDIKGSDLDIVCCYADPGIFMKAVAENFAHEKDFGIAQTTTREIPAVVARFSLNEFDVEIFGQEIPVKQQYAYRHMIIEHKLLQQGGEALRQKIVALKQAGYKTEPAFAKVLGLQGDPYLALLEFERE